MSNRVKRWLGQGGRYSTDWWKHHHCTSLAVAVSAFILAAALSLWPREISTATREFGRQPFHGQIARWVFAFWVLLLVWVVSLYWQLRDAEQDLAERVRAIRQAIDRAPNPNVFGDAVKRYFPLFDRLMAAMRLNPTTTPADRRVALEAALQQVLNLFIDLAVAFNGRIESERYGANLMIVVHRSPELGPAGFTPKMLEVLKFHDRQNTGDLLGVLYLPPALLHRNGAASDTTLSHGFALPMLDVKADASRRSLLLPGAPQCVDQERANAYSDTREMEPWLGELNGLIRRDVKDYFASTGRHVRSFASYPIVGATFSADGTAIKQQVAGVLNLDCADPALLGPDHQSYTTFEALVTPLLRQLVPVVVKYAELLVATGDTALTVTVEKPAVTH